MPSVGSSYSRTSDPTSQKSTNRWHKVYLYRLKENWETGGPRASLVVRSSTWCHCLRAEFPQPRLGDSELPVAPGPQ